MSQTTPPALEGHIDAPSRLELFWENNKRVIYFGLVAVALAIGIKYAWAYKEQRARAETWSKFAVITALDQGYAKPNSMWDGLLPLISSNPQTGFQYLSQLYLPAVFGGLASDLPKQLASSDEAELKRLAAGSDERAPLAAWVLANRAYYANEFDAAITGLRDLKQRFPTHFLCQDSPYPVQWRGDVKQPEEENDAKDPKKPKKPELKPFASGNLVDAKIAQAEAEKQFRTEHSEYYIAPEPDSSETLVFEIAQAGTIKVKLFSSRAPEIAAALLQRARDGWWVDQHVHQVERKAPGFSDPSRSPSHFEFGWPSSKSEDRSTWKVEDLPDESLLDWQATGVSLFPGMVSLPAGRDSKAQLERLIFNADDEAQSADGTRIVIGRVVEGLDVVRQIVDAEFADDKAAESGRGRPLEAFKITAVRVE